MDKFATAVQAGGVVTVAWCPVGNTYTAALEWEEDVMVTHGASPLTAMAALQEVFNTN